MGRKNVYVVLGLATLTILSASCQKSADDPVPSVSTESTKSLYVSSGGCNSGPGVTTYTAATSSRAITKYPVANPAGWSVFTDFNLGSNVSVGTAPQDIMDKGDYLLMLTENVTTMGNRKIFKVMKNDPNTYITVANDPTAFTAIAGHVTRSFTQDADGTFLFSKSLMAERVNSLGVRMTKAGANPWVNPLVATGSCFTAAATLIAKIQALTPFTNMNQGKLLYIHSGATAATNRIGLVSRTGLTSGTAADCVGTNPAGGMSTVAHANATNVVGPITFAATGASPTSFVYIPTPAPATTTGKLLVTYSASVAGSTDNATNLNYGIVIWDITETSDTAATVTNPIVLYSDYSVVFAPSAITYDSDDNSVYVAVGGSPGVMNQTTQNFGYNIEKFTLDLAGPTLTRVADNNLPFIKGNAYTKCVSSMMIAE